MKELIAIVGLSALLINLAIVLSIRINSDLFDYIKLRDEVESEDGDADE